MKVFSEEFRKQFYELLAERKSIRRFKKDPVSGQVLERILSAATHAPSGKNLQNWRFVILKGERRDSYVSLSQKSWASLKDVLAKRLKPSLYQFTERFFFTLGDAPVVVLCYSLNDPEENDLTSMGSVYMAVQNLNLACFAEGLGCCTMGAPLEIQEDVDRFSGADQLPEHKEGRLQLLCAVAIGYSDHEPPKAPRQVEGRFNWGSFTSAR